MPDRRISRYIPGLISRYSFTDAGGAALYPIWARLPVTYDISGDLQGQFVATATVYASRNLSGDLVGELVTSGTLVRTTYVSGDLSAVLTATATLGKIQFLSADLVGEFLGTADLIKATTISGDLTAVVTITGALTRTAYVTASLLGEFVATATIEVEVSPQQIDGEYQILPGTITYDRLAQSLVEELFSRIRVESLSPAPDGVETVFTLPSNAVGVKAVFIDGVEIHAGFSQTGSNEITFSVAPTGTTLAALYCSQA